MSDVWNEMKQRAGEDAPLAGPKAAKMKPREKETDILETGFTLNDIQPAIVRSWIALQVVGLLFQLSLWSDVGTHLNTYEEVVARECSRGPQHGVCVGPMWNIASWQDQVLKGGAWHGQSHSFEFATRSSPPTFLVAIDPVTQAASDKQDPAAAPDLDSDGEGLKEARWTMEVTRVNPPQTGPAFHKYGSGQRALTIEDLSLEAQQSLATRGSVDWKATLTSRASGKATRFVSFVEDAMSPHLQEIHASTQCAFGRAWKAFNEQHQGRSHRALAWCQWLLGIFLLVGAAAAYLVYRECLLENRGKYRFHYVIAAKFILMDVPLQVCIVLYILGWYEGEGLRCQLCLFDPQHCGYESPFHLANIIAFGCVLLSSVANQLLVRPVFKKTYTEDDICLQHFIRIGGVCVATLPFTTGICWASASILEMPILLHVLFAVPCGLGWITLTAMICFPIMVCCDEMDC